MSTRTERFFAERRAWWCGLGAGGRYAPLGIGAVFLAAHAVLGGLRADHAALVTAALAIYYAGSRLRMAGRFLLPLLLMVAIYDGQRYWAEELRGRVRVSEPNELERAWFGVKMGGETVTPAAWLQEHTHAVLDLVCGAAYLVFVPVFLLAAAWWRFAEKRVEAEGVMWAMLWLNLSAYVVWMLYPAAPPWYVDRHGLGPALLSALPEAGGAARFDALLGVTWFADYYGRNANVFGAIPSLHVGQTFLAALFAWRFRSLRAVTTGFWLLTLFASVYLNHHYLVDGLAGMALAAVAWAAVRGAAKPAALFTEPTVVTAANGTYWRCLYQFLLSVERRGLHTRHRVVVWDIGLGEKPRARLTARFPWAVFETLDFDELPPHVRPERRNYAWKPVVVHRTMETHGGRLVWFDSAALIHGEWDDLTKALDEHGLYALRGQSALRLRCDEGVQRRLEVEPEVLDQPEFVACLLGFDTRRPAVRALLGEWQRLALDPLCCPSRHPGNTGDQALMTILIRRGVRDGKITINRGEMDISSPYPVRWASSRNKVPAWLPVWADPLARLWYATYKAADRQVLRAKAARSRS